MLSPRVMTSQACPCRAGMSRRAAEERARELIAMGCKVQAIKLIRGEMGVGLMKDAKDVADGLSESPG